MKRWTAAVAAALSAGVVVLGVTVAPDLGGSGDSGDSARTQSATGTNDAGHVGTASAASGSKSAVARHPVPAEQSDTLFGVTVWAETGESFSEALAADKDAYGPVPLVRYFHGGLPQGWGPTDWHPASVHVSFKAEPEEVLAGTFDTELRAWFASAPRDRTSWWTYYHEPEDEIEAGRFTAAEYRAAWRHLSALADEVHNPKLRATLVLMDWTLDPAAHRNWRDYFPGRDALDVFGWDVYSTSHRRYDDPRRALWRVESVAREVGLPWAVPELGAVLTHGDDGSGRAAWIREATAFAQRHEAEFAAWFDAPVGMEYRLRDAPSTQAWREAVSD